MNSSYIIRLFYMANLFADFSDFFPTGNCWETFRGRNWRSKGTVQNDWHRQQRNDYFWRTQSGFEESRIWTDGIRNQVSYGCGINNIPKKYSLSLFKISFCLNIFCVLWSQADIDNSGTIDYGEFLAATLHMNKMEREENLVAAFSYFDKDGSGYITIDELQSACTEFGLCDTPLDDMIKEIDLDNVTFFFYFSFFSLLLQYNCIITNWAFEFGRTVRSIFRSLRQWCGKEMELGEAEPWWKTWTST